MVNNRYTLYYICTLTQIMYIMHKCTTHIVHVLTNHISVERGYQVLELDAGTGSSCSVGGRLHEKSVTI